jgi:hypothetical protein
MRWAGNCEQILLTASVESWSSLVTVGWCTKHLWRLRLSVPEAKQVSYGPNHIRPALLLTNDVASGEVPYHIAPAWHLLFFGVSSPRAGRRRLRGRNRRRRPIHDPGSSLAHPSNAPVHVVKAVHLRVGENGMPMETAPRQPRMRFRVIHGWWECTCWLPRSGFLQGTLEHRPGRACVGVDRQSKNSSYQHRQ